MKKFAVGALTLATAGTALLGSAGSADAATYNLRSGPGTQYRVVGQIHNPGCRLLMVDDWTSRNIPRQRDAQGRGMWYYLPERRAWILDDDWCV